MPLQEAQLKNLVIQPVCSFHKDGSAPTPGTAVFVFGSNLSGVHGAGAARAANRFHGAEMGVGVGFTGNSYAIPTKDKDINTMPLAEIKPYIDDFNSIVKHTPNKKYFVTRIGCVLAGYSDEEIAPLFKAYKNCSFAEEWKGLVSKP